MESMYGEKDAAEMEETVEAAPIEAVEMYSEKQRAKRHECLGVGQFAELALGITDTNLAQHVSEWLKAHGFPGTPRVKTRLCRSPGPYVQIGDAFICQKSGFVHICGEHCRECVLDPATNALVCPISGRSADRKMTEWEEFSMTGNVPEADIEDFSGRVGRTYTSGYKCSNESELRRFCGVQLS
eukprot:evm.model.scf_733EXC.1 EVM.evm.TU.scf_733EXC.1   scf_733EXC:26485-27807(-)